MLERISLKKENTHLSCLFHLFTSLLFLEQEKFPTENVSCESIPLRKERELNFKSQILFDRMSYLFN